jgi:protein-tyrosine phosphatase
VIKVVFVCLGNICRSPTAEGIFRHLVDQQGLSTSVSTDSSGTSGWHIGEPPDRRAQQAARAKGIDLSDLKSRKSKPEDFINFNYVIAMDQSNYDDLLAICPTGYEGRLHMFLSYAPELGKMDVPDPYYHDGFDTVFDMLESASQGLLSDIRARHNL